MRIDPLEATLPDPNPPGEYVVRLWRPGAHALKGWRTETWTLTDVTSVEQVIAWARERGGDDPGEVLLLDESGAALRLWGNEPEDISTSHRIWLTQA